MMNLIIGMIIGAVFGLFVMAMMSTSGNLSRCEECSLQIFQKIINVLLNHIFFKMKRY